MIGSIRPRPFKPKLRPINTSEGPFWKCHGLAVEVIARTGASALRAWRREVEKRQRNPLQRPIA